MAVLTEHEAALRLSAFFGVLLLMLGWETLAPRRRDVRRAGRDAVNLTFGVFGVIVARLFAPLLPLAAALYAESRGLGLFSLIDAPGWLAFVSSIVLLDLSIYAQHVAMHHVPLLWRLHRMHHSDTGFDTTTGVRFHPLEILLSLGWKLVVVVALGAPPAAVVAFEILLSATSLFNHGNVRMLAGLDRALRWLIVTPDMHRVHHSSVERETNRNFGFNLSLWDRLFATYRERPAAGYAGMQFGLTSFRDAADQRLGALLLQPIRRPGTDDPPEQDDG